MGNPSNREVGGDWGSGDYILIPEGEYVPVRVLKAKATTAQSSGNPLNDLELEVIAGEFTSARIMDRTVLNYPNNGDPNYFPNRKRRWFQESCGAEFRLDQSPEEVAYLVVGKILWVKVGHRPSGKADGKVYNSVAGAHPNYPCKDWTPPFLVGGASAVPGDADVELDPDIDLTEDEDFFVD